MLFERRSREEEQSQQGLLPTPVPLNRPSLLFSV
jgi:hypothetical protein